MLSRSFLVAILCLSLIGQAFAQDLGQRRLLAPYGVAERDRTSLDPFGDILVDRKDRSRFLSAFRANAFLTKISTPQRSEGGALWGAPPLHELLEVEADSRDELSALQNGVSSVDGAIVAKWLAEYGDQVSTQGGELAAARIARYLDARIGGLIAPNGVVNFDRLLEFGNERLRSTIESAEFLDLARKAQLLADFAKDLNIEDLAAALRGNRFTKLTASRTDSMISAVNSSYLLLLKYQASQASQGTLETDSLRRVESRLDAAGSDLEWLASAQMPAGQKLALATAGALTINNVEELKVESSSDKEKRAADIRKEYKQYADDLHAAADLMELAGVDPGIVDATDKVGNLLFAGGVLAASIVAENPYLIFASAASFVGAVANLFGGSPKPDPNQAMMLRIFRELKGLTDLIRKNHEETMKALRRIALKLDDLEDTINRRFAQLGFDVALTLVDTRELLYEDVRTCERLVDEFSLPATQELVVQGGLLGLSIFLESDNRSQDFSRCLNGLIARQRVVSERDFSAMLRADVLEEPALGSSAATRRDLVRRVEQAVLQPTVGYMRATLDITDSGEVAKGLFRPSKTLCDALWAFGKPSDIACDDKRPAWPRSRISRSSYNPGQGSLLSPATALLMAKFTRSVAPWNGVLVDSGGSLSARVISEVDAKLVSKRTASRRTRHLLALNNAVDALDLNIGQAQVLSGLPAISAAADILDGSVIPAYARARRLNDPSIINGLLQARSPDASLPGPNCIAESKEWNTLCLMETNPTFAKNVVKMLIAKRLKRAGATFEDWRRAIRSPFSDRMQELIGPDVMIKDAVGSLEIAGLGVWAFELPRVYSNPSIKRPDEGGSKDLDCWTPGWAERLANEEGLDKSQPFYTKQTSSRCYIIDTFSSGQFELLAFSTSMFDTLVLERLLLVTLIEELCRGNRFYPENYCTFYQGRESVSLDADLLRE